MKQPFDMPCFGILDLAQLEESYDASIECQGHVIRLDLNFWSYDGETLRPVHQMTTQAAEALRSELRKLDEYLVVSRHALREDWINRGKAREYTDHHAEVIAAFSDLDQDSLFAKLHPSRCGIYPFFTSGHLIVDFTLGETVTNYVLAVTLSHGGTVESIAMES